MSLNEPTASGQLQHRGPGYRLSRGDKIIGFALLLGLICLLLFPFTFFIVHPGQVGVLFRLLTTGTETEFVFREGLGVKWPWNRIYYYEVRTQSRDEAVHALAVDGLSITASITVLFHPLEDKAGLLHKNVGEDYVERLVRPVTIEAVRDVIGKVGPHDLYKMDVSELADSILSRLKSGEIGYVSYQSVLVRDIRLPDLLDQAITRKLTEEQNAQAYEYLIRQAEKEAERKRIEGIGIQTFYSIVGNSLSTQLLTWRGIEATVEIARSNNSKVVIVGGGKDQLPLILGSDIANQATLPTPSAVDPQSNQLPRFDSLPRMFPPLAPSPRTSENATTPSTSSGARQGDAAPAATKGAETRQSTERP
jgi:regulator of protease activity HflC (stomatin/prohibitin superfamily)